MGRRKAPVGHRKPTWGKVYYRKEMVACELPECGKWFHPRSGNPVQRFCGARCRNVNNARVSGHKRGDQRRFSGVPGKNYPMLYGVRAHRAVAEEKLGRKLRPGEIVHHDDEDKWNFRPSNLIVVPSRGEHKSVFHARKLCGLHGCNAAHYARGFCERHYRRYMKRGTPFLVGERPWACTWLDCACPPLANGLCKNHQIARQPLPF